MWELLDAILKHSKKLVLMDGDVSARTLSFASSYGQMAYVNNINNEGNRSINLICDPSRWEAQLHADLERFYEQDK